MSTHETLHQLASTVRDSVLDFIGFSFIVLLGYLRQKLRARTRQALEMREPINTEDIMEKVIIDGKELDVKISFANGQLGIEAVDAGKDGGGNLKLFISTDSLLDKLAAAIPGTLDDAIIAVVKTALKSL